MFSTTTIFNIVNHDDNNNIRVCDTEDWSNDAEKSALQLHE